MAVLHLTGRGLAGGIPAVLGGLEELTRIDLDVNALTGEIPSELGRLSKLDHLYLFANELTGPIPAELGRLTKLEALDLADNQLSGEIPSELGSMSSLWLLVLDSNRLTGAIPPDLGDLESLEELWLRDNQLTGNIPASLVELDLDQLRLSGNAFSGCIPDGLKDAGEHDLDELKLPYCAEVPGRVPAPTVEGQSVDSLAVSWVEPTNNGPAITGYEVRYSADGGATWSGYDHSGTSTAATIGGLLADTDYQVQVRAVNDEGTGQWSESGTGSTAALAYFYPTSAAHAGGSVFLSGCSDLWECLDETEPDGDSSRLLLFNEGAVRLGFSVGSDAIVGTVTSVHFEATMAAATGTLEPGQYGYVVYSGSDTIADLSGQDVLGADYTEVIVSGTAITSGLSEGLDDAEIQISGPSSGPKLKITRVRMVVARTGLEPVSPP